MPPEEKKYGFADACYRCGATSCFMPRRVRDLEAKVDDLEEGLKQLNERLRNEGGLTEFFQVREGLKGVENRLGGVETEQSRHWSALNNLRDRLGLLETGQDIKWRAYLAHLEKHHGVDLKDKYPELCYGCPFYNSALNDVLNPKSSSVTLKPDITRGKDGKQVLDGDEGYIDYRRRTDAKSAAERLLLFAREQWNHTDEEKMGTSAASYWEGYIQGLEDLREVL